MSSRPARPEDVDEICASLPETELGTSWGDRPTWKVPKGPRGKGFCLYRDPGPTAIDPDTGEPYDDLLVVHLPSMADKHALIADDTNPFFDIDHFRNHPGVLVQLSRLEEMSVDDLREVLTEAWAHRAPRRVVQSYFGDGPSA